MYMKKYLFTLLLLAGSFTSLVKAQLQYANPILAGFYPDPSICRVGNDYYIVNSSFAYFPGLSVFHSKDLVNWEQIGSAMNRNEQLDLKQAGVSRGLFAPTIRYYNGTFYIICTLIDKGGNFLVTAKDPKGPWSNPVWLPEVRGIDPSLFFDDNGKAYIIYNSDPPNNKPLYSGHRTIRIIDYDVEKQTTVGSNRILVNGGVDITQHPVWIEGPHIYKIKGTYYLMCAEGGTGYNHSEVIFRSNLADSGYIPYDKNPILTQRHLDKSRKNPITTAGHADLVEGPGGQWYAVFLACRPYTDDFYNTGRETFMAPVTWKEGWPIINYGHAEVQYRYPAPGKVKKITNPFNGNYLFRDEFNTPTLNQRYLCLRNPAAELYSINNGKLTLPLKPATAAQRENPAFIGFRQAHLQGYGAASLTFNPTGENEKAGLLIFANEGFHYLLCKSVKNNQPVVELYQSPGKTAGPNQLLATAPLKDNQPLQLKIAANGSTYAFYYAEQPGQWKLLKDQVEAKFLSTQVSGGFVGCVYALYATSNGAATTNTAVYDWFEYKGNDSTFRNTNKP
jgi:xylan 1,4-beta-xylosidase